MACDVASAVVIVGRVFVSVGKEDRQRLTFQSCTPLSLLRKRGIQLINISVCCRRVCLTDEAQEAHLGRKQEPKRFVYPNSTEGTIHQQKTKSPLYCSIHFQQFLNVGCEKMWPKGQPIGGIPADIYVKVCSSLRQSLHRPLSNTLTNVNNFILISASIQ